MLSLKRQTTCRQICHINVTCFKMSCWFHRIIVTFNLYFIQINIPRLIPIQSKVGFFWLFWSKRLSQLSWCNRCPVESSKVNKLIKIVDKLTETSTMGSWESKTQWFPIWHTTVIMTKHSIFSRQEILAGVNYFQVTSMYILNE